MGYTYRQPFITGKAMQSSISRFCYSQFLSYITPNCLLMSAKRSMSNGYNCTLFYKTIDAKIANIYEYCKSNASLMFYKPVITGSLVKLSLVGYLY